MKTYKICWNWICITLDVAISSFDLIYGVSPYFWEIFILLLELKLLDLKNGFVGCENQGKNVREEYSKLLEPIVYLYEAKLLFLSSLLCDFLNSMTCVCIVCEL